MVFLAAVAAATAVIVVGVGRQTAGHRQAARAKRLGAKSRAAEQDNTHTVLM